MAQVTDEENLLSTIRKEYPLNHPQVIVIIGHRGSGKTATAHYILEQSHKQGRKCRFWAPLKMLREPDKYFKNAKPKQVGTSMIPIVQVMGWLDLQHMRYPNIIPNTVHLLDDVQLRHHAREWHKNVTIDKIISMSRHEKATLIYTTQETFRVDKNIIGDMDMLIVKKPSIFGAKFERGEIKKLMETIRNEFIKLEKEGKDARQYSFIMSDAYEGFVGPQGLPSYWTSELGDW